MKTILNLYSDGGLVGRNPSSIGGTYGFCITNVDGVLIHEGSGFISVPPSGKPITNNQSEMVAAILGFETVNSLLSSGERANPEGWQGNFLCDSEITIGRLFQRFAWANIPTNMRHRAQAIIAKLNLGDTSCPILPIALAGHPTKANLVAGFKMKDGERYPVSKWNKRADELCHLEAKSHKQNAT